MILLAAFALMGCNNNDDTISSTLNEDIENNAYAKILENRLSTLPNNAQVAIGLVHDGNVEYIGATNNNDILQGVDNAHKVFEIGSITKVFTSICLSSLIASNNASLDETLQNQFDFNLQAGANITLQQLANHTSGLPRLPNNVNEVEGFNEENPFAIYTYNNLKSYLQNHIVLNAPIGTQYEYSNLGMGILGYVLAQKKNTTYEELLQNTIFTPLEMTNSTTLLPNVNPLILVEGRDSNGHIVSHWDFAETMTGAGSIKSSVVDMVKFIQKNFEDDTIYNLPQQKTFEKDNNLFLGLGWSIFEENDFIILSHDGGTGGFSSMLMIDKEKKIGVIVLSNVEDYHHTVVSTCNDFILQIAN